MLASAKRKRKRKQSLDPGDPPYQHQHARMELDSHADTCAIGDACLVLQDTGRTVTVEGYMESAGSSNEVPVVTAAVAYDCPTTFNTYILIFHEALRVYGMSTHLINHFQLREQGIIVNDTPLQHLPDGDRLPESHSITSEDPPMHIPLSLQGTMSGFTVRVPTWEEINDLENPKLFHVHMTSSQPWDPHDKVHSTVEQSLRDHAVRGVDLFVPDTRDISQLQVRGQHQVVNMSLPLESLATTGAIQACPQGTTSEEPAGLGSNPVGLAGHDDATVKTSNTSNLSPMMVRNLSLNRTGKHEPIEGTFTDDGCYYVCPGNAPDDKVYSYERPVSLKSMQREQCHTTALDADRYAEALLKELGVTEKGLDDLSYKLAAASTTKKRPGFVDAQQLAKNWCIGTEAAKRTLEATTQLAVRDFTNTSGGRRLKPYHWVLNQRRLDCEVYTDTLFGKCKSLRGNTCAQVFATPFHYVRVFPMESKKVLD